MSAAVDHVSSDLARYDDEQDALADAQERATRTVERDLSLLTENTPHTDAWEALGEILVIVSPVVRAAALEAYRAQLMDAAVLREMDREAGV